MRAARGAKNLRRPMPVTIASIGKPLYVSKAGSRWLIEAHRKQILAIMPYNANEDIMTPNEAGTKADQSAASSSNLIVTNQPRVACNGGGGPLGHPKVWLTLGTDGKVTCPYCSCAFVTAAE